MFHINSWSLSRFARLLVLGILCVLCVFVVSPSYLSGQDAQKDKPDNRGISVVGKDGRTAVERGDFWLVVIGINNYINFPKLILVGQSRHWERLDLGGM